MSKLTLVVLAIAAMVAGGGAWGWRPYRSFTNVHVNTLQRQRTERFKETLQIKPDGTITDTVEVIIKKTQ